MQVICGLPALARAKPAKGFAKRSLMEWLPAGGSMLLTARKSLHSWRAGGPRCSAPRPRRTRGGVLRGEGQDKAVAEIGGHDRRLAIMDLGEAGLGIGVDEGV